jgi:hypothetical protein
MRMSLLSMLFVTIFLFIALAYSANIPETITLDSLSNIYGPVTFSHHAHAEMIGDCASCHHHSKKGSTPACGECHELITIYQYSGAQRETRIGLKGAYHLKCMGCHKDMGSGPVGCTDCHEKKIKK